jgi:hypothetical protein
MDVSFVCASWKYIGSFQNLLYSWVFQVQNKLHEASFYVGKCKNKWIQPKPIKPIQTIPISIFPKMLIAYV